MAVGVGIFNVTTHFVSLCITKIVISGDNNQLYWLGTTLILLYKLGLIIIRRFLTSWKGMKWWLICGNLWIGEMNNFYSEHETPAIDTPEDVAKALRFVWIPYRGHWLEMSNLTQFEKGGTYSFLIWRRSCGLQISIYKKKFKNKSNEKIRIKTNY